MDFTAKKLPPNPSRGANPISKLLFLWIIPFFTKGYKKELQEEDLCDILKEDETERLGNELEIYWQNELEKAKLTGKKPSLLRALLKISWKTFFLVVIVYCVNQCVIMTCQPIFLRLLIVTFNEREIDDWKAYTYAGAVSLTAFLNTLTLHPGVFQIFHLAMKLRVATSTLIYRKSLRLSKSAQNKTNSGQIVNLLSNDCTRFDTTINFVPFIVSAPFQFAILMYILYDQIGPACLAGVAFVTEDKQVIEKGKPVEQEEKKSGGSVTARTYWEYFTAGHSVFGFFSVVFTFCICQVFVSGNDYWLSYWTNAEAKRKDLENNVTICTDPNDKACEDTYLARSPLFTHVAATIQGLTTIRACKSQHILVQQFEGHQDLHSSSWYLFIAANRCFGIWLELISDIFLVLVAFSFLLISSCKHVIK
ncbi:Multidrug resistance-associated protein 4 [Orchesella cincta]|uniref:Multidrug resistance-associated protein 4 n=1 Tax=Orchesella cincta TaxID=48709 RepID=A0A1D2N1J0_ORCCI|nr:Multidrug resistance-associated protein 4 [Orchesella cincta]